MARWFSYEITLAGHPSEVQALAQHYGLRDEELRNAGGLRVTIDDSFEWEDSDVDEWYLKFLGQCAWDDALELARMFLADPDYDVQVSGCIEQGMEEMVL